MRNFVRFCLRAIFTAFKVRCHFNFDPEKLPERAVFVSNHVSYLDPIVLFAFLPGNPVFALNGHLYRNKWIRLFMRTADIVDFKPIEPTHIKDLIAKVDSGRTCVIFAEGRITENGGLMKIYEAPGLVADKSGAPLVPIWISGLEYSYFSKTSGKIPHRPLPKINITIGEPRKFRLKENLRRQRDHISNEVYMILREMGFEARYTQGKSLFSQLMKSAKVHAKSGWFFKRPHFIEDIKREPNSYKDLVVKAFALGGYFDKNFKKNEHIGILLPNSIAAVCSFFGLSAYDRIPVMLNFSTGAQNIVNMCKTSITKKIITSKMFIKQAGMEEVVEYLVKSKIKVIYLEDVAKEISLRDKIQAFINYKKKYIPNPEGGDKTAVILFTSGSEGVPKAVLLSHDNIISNIKQVSSIETLNISDTLFNALPMFHSFGLTIGTIFPLFEGSKLFLYPSPLHYRVVSEIVYETGATVMFGTDTFFRGYAKIAHPYDFHNIRFLFAGAEAVKQDTRDLWQERMGVRVLEAYGATECSPVITANNRIFNRFGSIGKLLPGMEYKIKPVDGIEVGGELCVKGPNVMKGYYLHDKPGVLVPLKDKWYDTGDVVDVDEIGFFFIKDRIKRFAKIGGEMVSLNAIDNMVREAYYHMIDKGYNYGVVAVPHDSKGEQIVLVTNNKELNKETLHQYIKEKKISELFLPRTIIYREEIPVFATGKLDNVTLKKEVLKELGI